MFEAAVDGHVQVPGARGLPQTGVPGQARHTGVIAVLLELGLGAGGASSLEGTPIVGLAVTLQQAGEKIEDSVGTSQMADGRVGEHGGSLQRMAPLATSILLEGPTPCQPETQLNHSSR